ncbi:1,2-phenylacetyl-CoA epoxidase subunit PaaC [Microbacterium sp. B35-30]|uniref:1,2-phenylacetyl-CoA epoxidase subunit PaaC n=1 Tax=Microbacterium sp. B35-30 TaxID=1962642 RepID=UPI0013D4F6B4|nr:1,2-phenylacetyl-CoA epoxidase subunit PaaC [Microbacterium sp. B35-30]
MTVERVALSAELAGGEGRAASADVAEYALWLGDDALILSQQLGAWIARAPELEEDVALANIALDLLGHARSFLRYAGTYDDRSEDDLAYWRDEPEFRCAWLFQQPDGDFAQTIVRQLAASVYLFELYTALQDSSDVTLAAIAAKAVKEVEYHRDHAVQWTLRLAGGTDESRRRMIRAVGDVWPYVAELFRDEPLIDRLDGVAVRPSTLQPAFDAVIAAVFAEAEVELPTGPMSSAGGRNGHHFSTLGFLLAEMQVLARQHPGATW